MPAASGVPDRLPAGDPPQPTRSGFVVDHVQYFSDALKTCVARREQLGKFVLRRDPRDISRVWVLDPDGMTYVAVPYRVQSRPPISIWEQQAAIARLREQGRADVDEQALFATVEQMREITDTAAATTRSARRDRERLTAVPVGAEPPVAALMPPATANVPSKARPPASSAHGPLDGPRPDTVLAAQAAAPLRTARSPPRGSAKNYRPSGGRPTIKPRAGS
ncbi:Mu transposase C-terminal domain-containing protein [Kribbella sp. NPDC004138]